MGAEERRWLDEEAARGVFGLLEITARGPRPSAAGRRRKRRPKSAAPWTRASPATRPKPCAATSGPCPTAAVKARWSEQALRKTTLPPGQKAWGMVGFAHESLVHVPQGLILQDRLPGDGGLQDLGRYGIVEDALPPPRMAPPARTVSPAIQSLNKP